MSVIGGVQEYREMGDSWPKAIRSYIDLWARVGWAVIHVGEAISKVGEKIVPGSI
jgi:hypothetical protein